MTQTTFNSTDMIDRQEEETIAGFRSEEPLMLEPEYKLAPNEEQPEVPEIEERPLPRTLFVMLGVGSVMVTLLGIWWVIKPKSPNVVMQPEPLEEEQEVASEDESRARLAEAKVALALQQQELQDSQSPKATPVETSEEDTTEEDTTVQPTNQTTTTKPRTSISRSSSPTSTPRQPSSRVTKVSQPSQPVRSPVQRAVPSPMPQPVASLDSDPPAQITTPPKAEPIDPFERWQQLANHGHQQGELPELVASHTNSPTIQPVQEAPSPSSPSQPIPVMTIGYEQEASPLSPGARGILERRPVTPSNSQQIPFGTTAPATVSVPLVWNEGSDEQLYDRFAVTLTEDLKATDGTVVLSAGTVFIAEVNQVETENRFVQASATAIIYTDEQGQVQQQSLPKGMVLIQGEQGNPLIAEGHFDAGGDIAKQDLLISTLSGLGRVGEVFTEPEQVSTISNGSTTGTSNTTIIRSREPQIWSAVLDGFFNPLAERMAQRSQQQIEELANRPNLAVIPVGTETSITINGLLNLTHSSTPEVVEESEIMALSSQQSSPIPPFQPEASSEPLRFANVDF